MNNIEEEVNLDITLDDAITLSRFFKDGNKNFAASSKSFNMDNIQYLLKELFINNHKNMIEKGNVLVILDGGFYGSINIKTVDDIKEPVLLSAKSGNYDFITIRTNYDHYIAWTDFSTIEPFNRQSPFYVPFSFKSMVRTKVTEQYQELQITTKSNISFGLCAFSYNSYWKTVRFAMCIEANKLEEVLSKLKLILNK